ncbi:hypothetical protein TH53_01070 [Pedobacter lusitanus]|uniref:Tyrosine decarboxylase n=1 Tax=Pedobacter lusitanus TaxID=1503925 RepID=A0A0D0GNW0_9SPHI|nr:pyridoxal-dependent decarboxylase [Pedobacter lusitanus]KIO78922.1 hypothetical protein TH53_01070 [Pedobacter lusitanus]
MSLSSKKLFPLKGNQVWTKETLKKIVDDFYAWYERHQPSAKQDKTGLLPSDSLREVDQLVSDLSDRLGKESIPWASQNYIAHMNTDIPLVASLTYFMTMLYNPNNVTPEVSPVTTALERELSIDFCNLLGYNPASGWAHLSSGGHASNYEAMWIARNLKSVPYAILQNEQTSMLIADKDQLVNMPVPKILALLDQVAKMGLYTEIIELAGLLRHDSVLKNGKVLLSENCHYAWDKCLDLLGIQKNNVEKIAPDKYLRTDNQELYKRITWLIEQNIPVIAVVLFVGSSGEGSVDNLSAMFHFRDLCQKKYGQSFYIHVDAAYGGYFRSVILDDQHEVMPYEKLKLEQPAAYLLKPEVYNSLRDLPQADSITIDPHKSGYVPYPGGCVAYKDRRLNSIIATQSKYFGQHPDEELNFGPYTLEGARPGAVASAVWSVNRLLPLNSGGLGMLLKDSLKTTLAFTQIIKENQSFLVDDHLFHVLNLYEPDLTINNFLVVPAKKGTSFEEADALNKLLAEELKSGNKDYINLFFSGSQVNYQTFKKVFKDSDLQSDHENTRLKLFRSCLMKDIPTASIKGQWNHFLGSLTDIIRNQNQI